jgi:hypothetical protein
MMRSTITYVNDMIARIEVCARALRWRSAHLSSYPVQTARVCVSVGGLSEVCRRSVGGLSAEDYVLTGESALK